MTGLGRILRRRADAPEADVHAARADAAEPQPVTGEEAPSHEGRTAVLEPVAAAPAPGPGARPDRAPTFRRSRARRRLRYLRRAREVLLRDLGGLVYEIHRAGGAGDRARHDALVAGKVERLRLVDAELHELASMLGDVRRDLVVRQPGVGGTCPACGELHAADAQFCSRCGARVDGSAGEAATSGHVGVHGTQTANGTPGDLAPDEATSARGADGEASPEDAPGAAAAPGGATPEHGGAPDEATPQAGTPGDPRPGDAARDDAPARDGATDHAPAHAATPDDAPERGAPQGEATPRDIAADDSPEHDAVSHEASSPAAAPAPDATGPRSHPMASATERRP